MKSAFLALALSFAAVGCASAPTAAELAAADYGPRPTDIDQCKETALALMKDTLRDPEPLIEWVHTEPLETGWYRKAPIYGGGTYYGWSLKAYVNSRNAYGGYVGRREWTFLFQGDTLVSAAAEEWHSAARSVVLQTIYEDESRQQ